MNKAQPDLAEIIESLIERLENARFHQRKKEDTPNQPETICSGRVSVAINSITVLDNNQPVLSFVIRIGEGEKLRGVICYAPLLYTRQNQQYRHDLLSREIVRGVYTIAHSRNSWAKTALILFDRKEDSTAFAVCNNAEEVSSLILNETPENIVLHYSRSLSAENLLPNYYSGEQEEIENAFQNAITKNLDEVAEIIPGKNIRSTEYLAQGIPFLRARDIQGGKIMPATVHLSPKMGKACARQLLQDGDILLTKHFGQRKLALVSEADLPAIASEALFIIRPFAVSESYLYRYLTSKTGNAVFNAQLQRIEKGVTIPSVSLADLAKVQVPVYDEATMITIEQLETLSKEESVETALSILRSFGSEADVEKMVINDLSAAGWNVESAVAHYDNIAGNCSPNADLVFTLPDNTKVLVEIKKDLACLSPELLDHIDSLLMAIEKCFYILTTGTYYEVHVTGRKDVYRRIHAPSMDELLQWERGLN